MKDFTADEIAGYNQRSLIIRDLVYVSPQDRATGALIDFGFWSGTGNISLQVVDGVTLQTVTRNFVSKGAVLDIGAITVADGLKVVSVDVGLSQLNADVENAIRGYDMRYAPIQIYRALFSNANPRALVAPARCRFAGFVNAAPINTASVGGSSSINLTCVGCTNELTRTNTQLRSDESQRRRYPGDRFFQYVGVTGQVQIAWGAANDKGTEDPAAATVSGLRQAIS